MTIEEYWDNLTANEKGTFQRACRTFLKQTFIVRDKDEDSRKLYFFPPDSDKGSALQRFCERHSFDVIIAAGDSEMDLPMMKIADIALFRKEQKDFATEVLYTVLHTALV